MNKPEGKATVAVTDAPEKPGFDALIADFFRASSSMVPLYLSLSSSIPNAIPNAIPIPPAPPRPAPPRPAYSPTLSTSPTPAPTHSASADREASPLMPCPLQMHALAGRMLSRLPRAGFGAGPSGKQLTSPPPSPL